MNTSDSLKITLIQSNLFWEDKITNIKQFTNRIFDITEQTDLFVLPEMFSTGFTMNSEKLAETMDGFTVTWMKEVAMVKNAAICGSLIITENNEIFNRFLFVEPNGNVQFYLSAKLKSPPSKIKIKFDLLMERFPDQQNKLTFRFRDKKLTYNYLTTVNTHDIILNE